MLNRRTFLASVALGALGVPGALRGSGPAGWLSAIGEAGSGGAREGDPPAIIVCAIGDLERTSAAGMILMSQASGIQEREKLITGVVEANPSLLLLLGDQVGDSGSELDWSYFDTLTAPFRDADILTLAVRGEHDYSVIHSDIAEREVSARWPGAMNRPQFHTIGSIAFIGLDSNLELLSEGAAREQHRKYIEALAKYDADPAIRGVVVFAHHPPYSNSTYGANDDMITLYAEPFIAARKTGLFLCGHVHSYERFSFKDGQKQFVTSGGGGAPRRSLDISESRRFTNDHAGPLGPVRPFNFVKLTITDTSITGEVMLLQSKGFVLGDRFRVALQS